MVTHPYWEAFGPNSTRDRPSMVQNRSKLLLVWRVRKRRLAAQGNTWLQVPLWAHLLRKCAPILTFMSITNTESAVAVLTFVRTVKCTSTNAKPIFVFWWQNQRFWPLWLRQSDTESPVWQNLTFQSSHSLGLFDKIAVHVQVYTHVLAYARTWYSDKRRHAA